MKIILSPAKKMNVNTEIVEHVGVPAYIENTKEILSCLKEQSQDELKKLWKCNDKIAEQNFERLENMNLYENLTPAVLSYEGLAYQYMAQAVFEDGHLDYVQEHLRILSGFYGVLKAMDGVTPYRLEMQAKASVGGSKDLYQYWGDRLYKEVRDDSGIIINLASKEYSKCIEKYLRPGDRFITCIFGELEKGKVVQKGVYAKTARGEMVRYMASINALQPEQIQGFDRDGYAFDPDRSSEKEYCFIR